VAVFDRVGDHGAVEGALERLAQLGQDDGDIGGLEVARGVAGDEEDMHARAVRYRRRAPPRW
jgi:hypothetical protein